MTRTPAEDHAEAPGSWQGETYYDRPQVKPAPFDVWVVGGYIFLAGLSGAAAILGAVAPVDGARRPHRRRGSLARRARYLSLLAPIIGAPLLIYDLHTPQRFYNMLRIAKKTSPMSIGTWILMSFSAFAGIAGFGQIVSDLKPRWRWPRRVATASQVPAAIAGAGLATYTGSLISATSTPVWAAAPREIAARFASSSVAAASAALSMGETSPSRRRSLDNLLLAALTVELAASAAADMRYRDTGVEAGRTGRWGKVEKIGATGLGVLLPIGLLLASRMSGRRFGSLAKVARAAAIAGSAAMRVSILGVGAESARRPDVSMRFAQPDNLPER